MELRSQSERRTADGDDVVDAAAGDSYDDRHRQTKALERYERQKLAWERMQAHLMTAPTVPSSRRKKGGNTETEHRHRLGCGAQNMAYATATARAKREDNVILHVAAAASHSSEGSHAWEGLLRCTKDQESRRYVPIGRACLPCPIYGVMHDPNTLPDDHPMFARVVSEGDVADFSGTLKNKNEQSAASGNAWNSSCKAIQERAAAQEHVKASLTNSIKAPLKDLFIEDTSAVPSAANVYEDAENDLSTTSYYAEQLQRFAPYVQHRLGHFLQPRVFLHVEGRPAPYATAEDETRLREAAAAGGEDRPSSAPPVKYFAPPPQPPQAQLWAPSPSASHPPSADGTNGGASLSFRSVATSGRHAEHRYGQLSVTNENEESEEGGEGAGGHPCESISTAEPQHTEPGVVDRDHSSNTQSSLQPSPLHPMRIQRMVTSAGTDKERRVLELEQQSGPAMELSTRSLFFQTRPHELIHGNVTLRNAGTITIYYSWTVMDTMQEHLHKLYEEEREAERGEEGSDAATTPGSGGGEHSNRNSGSRKMYNQRAKQDNYLPYASLCLTHQLAAHQSKARESFFFMSAPMNGVVLPGAEATFPFSVRATREGLFQSTYELLTVPPAPERIFMRLRALVQRDGPSFEWLARPVAEALEAKVVVDAQRRCVQQIGADVRTVEAAELRDRVAALDGAAEVAKQAEKARRHAQEEAWHRANRLTFDHIPYHAAVYDKLERLSAVVRDTYVLLNKEEECKAPAVPLQQQSLKLKEAPADRAAEPITAKNSQKRRTLPSSAMPTSPSVTLVSPTAQSPQVPQLPCCAVEVPSLANMQWDGALLPLLHQIMNIRESALRQVFLDAMQVLLRAARASRDVVDASERESDNVVTAATEEQEEKDVPLTVLLSHAAAALADAVVDRQREMVEKQREGFLLQPVKPAAALSLAPAPLSEIVAASGTGKGRATAQAVSSSSGIGSSGNKARRKSAAAPGSGRNTIASIVEFKDGKDAVSGADGGTGAAAATTPAQRLLMSVIPAAALEGFSVAQANTEIASLLRAAEDRVVCARMESELAESKKALVALHTALFREAIDAACNRTPLASCTKERLAELREVQRSALLVVDISVDALIVPPVGKPGKRK
ncbi:hypothetical protein ABL78_2538 [Leptomonas seymouri]|uniref:MYCBP-associated protein n=1 Tax=Leptomonas seymouri TaxID=5684 RepID=A0A0N1I604_LEPSE|nr:hypothetical protein ABL78_2538 [Leptomonas seymouri]|eukprot:KPI88363.1 hypothetical protein ABL78_2538 [Leptomonas seymouri]